MGIVAALSRGGGHGSMGGWMVREDMKWWWVIINRNAFFSWMDQTNPGNPGNPGNASIPSNSVNVSGRD